MPSVLIVDDEPDIRLLVRCLVEEADWRVVGKASSGEEGVVRREFRPDVVLIPALTAQVLGGRRG
jgi:YesN/AraC family two-component response regulator